MEKALSYLEVQLPVTHRLLTERLGTTLTCIALFFLVLQWGYYGIVVAGAENYVTAFGPVIGGDYIVFHQAASTAPAEMAGLYDFETLNARLASTFPAYEDPFGLAWAYPPTMFLALAPFGWMPYAAAYGFWVFGGVGLFAYLAYRQWPTALGVLFVVAAPAVFQTAITGQTGLFAASLFFLAAFAPDKRPLVAGLAAGLLTVKPQLGLLIPLAYIACGAWRAFGVAALTSISFAGASFLAFGVAPWEAFFAHAGGHGELLAQSIFPVQKLTSVFGAIVTMGAPIWFAGLVQGAAFIGLAGFVIYYWRRSEDDLLKFAVLAGASVLATPYVFYYELPVVMMAMFLVTGRAVRDGWLPYEGVAIAALWLWPMFMPGEQAPAAPTVAFGAMVAFAVIARRALFDLNLNRVNAILATK